MKLDSVKFGRVDGGQFDSLEPTQIPKNGWARAYNFLSYGGRMNRRPGSAPFGKTTPPIASAITCIPVTGLVGAATGFEDWALMVISKTCEVALLKPSGAWGVKLTQLPGGSVVSDEMPWCARQRNGIVYAGRRNSGGLKRIEGGEWTNAGRPAPTAGATAAWAASGGTLTANAFRVAYTLYDSVTGYEGNGTEISVTGAPASNGKIQVASLQPPDASVKFTHYAIYMTQADGATFYLHQLLAKASTSVELTAAPSGSTTLSTRNGLPDSNGIGFEIWNERGWIITSKHLFYSDLQKIESYSAVQDLPFNPDDNDEHTTVYGWGDYLVVAKRRAMVLLEGVDRTSWNQRLWTEMSGCVAPQSMRDCEGELVWLGEDGFCTATIGTLPALISNETVRAALKSMDRSQQDIVTAETIPSLNLYVATFPRKDGSWGGVAYNWKKKAWSEIEFPAKPRYLYTGFDETGAVRIFAIMDSSVQPYVVFEGKTDDGSAIESFLVSSAPDLDGPRLSSLESVALLCSATRSPVEFTVIRDTSDSSAPLPVSLLGDPGWKRVKLGTVGMKGSQLQLKIRYAGPDDFWVSDMEWEVLQTAYERRTY